MQRTTWQDIFILLLGLWLWISPLVLSYTMVPEANVDSLLLGILIGLMALAAIGMRQRWSRWVVLTAGIWLAVSPWVLHYASAFRATWDAVIVGLLVVVFAGWAAATDNAGHTSSV